MSTSTDKFGVWLLEKYERLTWTSVGGDNFACSIKRDATDTCLSRFRLKVCPDDLVELYEVDNRLMTITVPGIHEKVRRLALNVDHHIDVIMGFLQ